MTLLFPGILIFATVLLMELGRWLGNRWRSRNGETSPGGGTVEGAVFSLMGLLIAFAIYGAESRFDRRRSLIVDEANAINTAYALLDLLPANTQPHLRSDFREYVQSRLTTYQKVANWESVQAMQMELRQSAELQREIWKDAVDAIKQADSPSVQALLLPAIDRMIGIETTRTVALETHLPVAVWAMLAFSVLASCVLAGYSMSSHGSRHWVHTVSFCLLFSAAVYVLVDFEYPRMQGFIRIHELDRLLNQTLENMR